MSLLRILCLLAMTSAFLGAADRPNMIVILVDDLGYGDLSSYGAEEMRTPAIDRLMDRGARFDQFYANCTVCTPTRASLLTGRYPDMVGAPGVIRQNLENSWGFFDPSATTLPQILGEAGYHTGMVGKWHLGYEAPNIPNRRGFDFFHGFLGDMMDDYWTHLRGGENWMRHNEKIIDPEGHATEIFSDWAIDYINDHAKRPDDKPFFLYLAYNAPHFPIQPPEDWIARVKQREPQLSELRAINVAFVEHLDHHLGRVINAVGAAGIDEETLIVFSSDNGGSIPHGALNTPWRGGKQDHWEGGIRVPTCVVWPGKISARRSDIPGMTMDLLPTLAGIAGVSVDHKIDGQDLGSVWLEDGSGDPDRTMIWVRREGNNRYQGRAYYAIRQGPWKLTQSTPFEPMQLVNLDDDPYEQNPLPAKGPVALELIRQLRLHLQEAGTVPWQP
ncbi:MAG: sulfatase-like hydrolase/transferase [Opitutaceae bacterium]|jgi:arylsulfatase A-like enzyme|nr:sulfatase-like hydrolase/transferase [Opitutaceae bacterium]